MGSLRQLSLEEALLFCVKKRLLPETDSELSDEDKPGDPEPELEPVCVGPDTQPRRSSRVTIRREVMESPYNSQPSPDVDSEDLWIPMRRHPGKKRSLDSGKNRVLFIHRISIVM